MFIWVLEHSVSFDEWLGIPPHTINLVWCRHEGACLGKHSVAYGEEGALLALYLHLEKLITCIIVLIFWFSSVGQTVSPKMQ